MLNSFTAKSITKNVTAIATLSVLFGGPVAMAQTGGKGSSNGAKQSQSSREAPIGHRQPRANQFPSENNLGDPSDPLNKENAALDRKLKSICRGC